MTAFWPSRPSTPLFHAHTIPAHSFASPVTSVTAFATRLGLCLFRSDSCTRHRCAALDRRLVAPQKLNQKFGDEGEVVWGKSKGCGPRRYSEHSSCPAVLTLRPSGPSHACSRAHHRASIGCKAPRSACAQKVSTAPHDCAAALAAEPLLVCLHLCDCGAHRGRANTCGWRVREGAGARSRACQVSLGDRQA